MNDLNALSPLDGRYAEITAPLRDAFSEFAYLRERVRLELDYLSALSKRGLVRPLTDSESTLLDAIKLTFSSADAERIRKHEQETRHDVKAIEYFLREILEKTSLRDVLPWLHFGLTSEDVNSIAQAIALREARDNVLLPALSALMNSLRSFAVRYRALPMLARTHGQPAVPTTLGKEIAVYLARLDRARVSISAHLFAAKLTGATGNFNALHAAAPQVDWLLFSKSFVQAYGLEPEFITTQTLSYDNWIRFFDHLRLTNSILIDFAQDIWRYVSDGYLKQAVVEAEVGSSTMPQKVNPIDFENAEGNLGLGNAMFAHFAQKLPVSRLQRDLSDSTVRRTFGTALGHTLVAWVNLTRGMSRVAADEQNLRAGLEAHWEVVAEGAQTILRAAGRSDAYESLKQQARGRVLTEADFRSWLEGIDVSGEVRERLAALTPQSYIGLAAELVDHVLANERSK